MNKVVHIEDGREIQNGGGNGNGGIRERVKALETELKHLATKKDISDIKIWILVGVLGAIPLSVTMVLLVAKYFVN